MSIQKTLSLLSQDPQTLYRYWITCFRSHCLPSLISKNTLGQHGHDRDSQISCTNWSKQASLPKPLPEKAGPPLCGSSQPSWSCFRKKSFSADLPLPKNVILAWPLISVAASKTGSLRPLRQGYREGRPTVDIVLFRTAGKAAGLSLHIKKDAVGRPFLYAGIALHRGTSWKKAPGRSTRFPALDGKVYRSQRLCQTKRLFI